MTEMISRYIKKIPTGLWFVIPTLAFWLIWELWPIVYTVYLSLTNWNLLGDKDFIGFSNYVALTSDPLYWGSLKVTLIWLMLIVPAGVIIPLLLALCINSTTRLKEFFRFTYFLPVITPVIAVTLVWKYLYEPRFGLINTLLSFLGISGPNWLLDTGTALPAVAIMYLWRSIGFNMVIFLAALQSIPHSYLEAASIDGANIWHKNRHIVIPLLKPVTIFVIFISIILGLDAFSEIYIMTTGGPMHATSLLSYYLYKTGFNFLNMGYASAIAISMLLLTFILTAIIFFLMSDDRKKILKDRLS